jgi:hypothetical protein
MYTFNGRLSLFGVALLAAVATLPGCGPSGPKTASVSGKVTLDGTPLTSGTVNLVGDESKGNTHKGTSAGSIGPDGTYKVSTDGKDGAPLGWYKVLVVTKFPGAPQDALALDPKYIDATKTPLSYEVVASPAPGAYDLKVSK